MRIATVKIRHKRTGEVRKVNAIDYGSNMGQGKYAAWELVGEAHGDKPTEPTVSAKSIGVDAAVPLEELEASQEKSQQESPRYAQAQRSRTRKQQSLNAEVRDKELEE